MSFRRWCCIGAAFTLIPFGVIAAISGTAQAAVITSPTGPLRSINIGPGLTCQVNLGTAYPGEWLSTSGTPHCGTFLALVGTTYRPGALAAEVTGTSFRQVSQSAVTGSGTAASPFQIVTVVQAGTRATLTQTDSYVTGNDYYRTSLTVTGNSATPQRGTVYLAGNCSVAGNTGGYGLVNGTSPACAATQAVNSRGITLIPLTSGNGYEYNFHTTIGTRISARTPLNNACNSCNALTDNGMAISWPVSVSAGQSQTFAWATSFGVVGGAPLSVSVTAHAGTSLTGTANGYRVQVQNPDPASQTVSAISVTLPAGFTYQPGSSTGVTTSNPAVSGQVLTWTGPFAMAGGTILSVDFGVTVSGTPGTYTVSAAATSPHAVIPASSTAPVTVTALADLSVTGTASVSGAAPGDTFSYTAAVHNAGPSGVPSATMTDTLPPQLSFVSGPGCSASGQVVTCAVGAIAAGGNASTTVTVTVKPNAAFGVISNADVVVSSGVPDPNQLNNSVTESVLIRPTVALTITKTASAPTVTAGSNVTFTITVGNAGAGTATATLLDSLPAGMTAVSFTGPGCVLGTLRCALPVAGGGTATVTLVAQAADNVPAGTVLTNSATVDAPSNDVPAGVTASASVTVTTSAHLVLTKALATGLRAGQTGTYQLTVQDQGPSVATGVTVTDTLPAGLTFNAAASSAGCTGITIVTCAVGFVDLGASASLIIAVNVPATTTAGTSMTNTASAAGHEPNPVPADAASSVTSTVARLADLVLGLTGAPDPVVAGATITYTLPVASKGPSNAGGVTVTATMPADITATAASVTTGTGTCTIGATVTCTLGTVAAGSTPVITIAGTVAPSASGVQTATAAVTSADPVKNPLTTTATDHASVVAVAGLSASVVASANPVAAGAPLDLTITVVNKGPSDATVVTLNHPLPAGYTATSAIASNGAACTVTGGVLSCPDLGTLSVNGTVTVTLHGSVAAAQPAGTLNNTAAFTDAEGGSAVAQESLTVFDHSGITMTELVASAGMVAGNTATGPLVVHNAGPSDATNVVITALPSPYLRIDALSFGSGTCDIATLTCTIARIPAGGTVDLLVTVTVDPETPASTITNCASYKSSAGAADDVTTCLDLTITRLATLTLAKVSQTATAIAGGRVSYQLTAGGAGPSSATGTVVTDTLPAGLTFDPTGSSAGCSATGQVVSCPVGLLDPGDTSTLFIVATIGQAVSGTVTNTAAATAVEAPAPATASADTLVHSEADLVITKTAGPAFAGQDMTWHIAVDSVGPSTATGVVINSTIPAGASFVSAATDSGSCAFQAATGLLTCHPGPIADDARVTVTLVTHIPANLVPPGRPSVTITDPATVTYSGDPNPGNNAVTAAVTVFPLATLQLTKTVSSATLVAGTLATFRGTVKNAGPSVATGVTYTDTLPTGLAFDPAGSDHRCTAPASAGNQVSCAAGPLNPGTSTTFLVAARIAPTLGPRSVLVNDAQATAAQTDPVHVTSARASFLVIRKVGLVVTHTASRKRVAAGATFSFTVRVVNRGPSAASGVVVSDPAAALLSGRIRPGDGIALTCPRGGISFRCIVPELAPGASVSFLVDVTARRGTVNGTLACDTARVTAREPDTRPADNHATACATITSKLLPPLFVPVTG